MPLLKSDFKSYSFRFICLSPSGSVSAFTEYISSICWPASGPCWTEESNRQTNKSTDSRHRHRHTDKPTNSKWNRIEWSGEWFNGNIYHNHVLKISYNKSHNYKAVRIRPSFTANSDVVVIVVVGIARPLDWIGRNLYMAGLLAGSGVSVPE